MFVLFGEYSSLSYASWKEEVDSLKLNRMLYSFQALVKEGFQNQTWCNHCGDGNWDHVTEWSFKTRPLWEHLLG